MSSTTMMKNDVLKNFIQENKEEEEIFKNQITNHHRSSFVPRHISFSQRQASIGEIILVLLPYFIFLVDVLIFFILRGF